MRRDQRVDGTAQFAQCPIRTRFILAHQPAVTDHVRMQNGGEFPFRREGGSARQDEARLSTGGIANTFDLAADDAHHTRLRNAS